MSQINKKIDQELAKLDTNPHLDYRYRPDADSVNTEFDIKDLFGDTDFITLGIDGSDTIFLQDSSSGQYTGIFGTGGSGVNLTQSFFNTGSGGIAYSQPPSYSTHSLGGWGSLSQTVNITNNGINLPEDGDIQIGNRSVKQMLETIEQRLSILVPDPKKLQQYEALKQAYEHYRTLEALCVDPDTKDSV